MMPRTADGVVRDHAAAAREGSQPSREALLDPHPRAASQLRCSSRSFRGQEKRLSDGMTRSERMERRRMSTYYDAWNRGCGCDAETYGLGSSK
eukprot:442509-Rhodomonas_salina.1